MISSSLDSLLDDVEATMYMRFSIHPKDGELLSPYFEFLKLSIFIFSFVELQKLIVPLYSSSKLNLTNGDVFQITGDIC